MCRYKTNHTHITPLPSFSFFFFEIQSPQNKMPPFSQKPSPSRNISSIRSITLPVRSHPTTHKVEQELYKLKACEALLLSSSKSTTTTTISNALSGLVDLYKSIEGLLGLALTRQALSQHQQDKWVHQLLDDSLRYLDFCGSARDNVLLMKESVRELQSAIRRSKVVGESSTSSIESSVSGYASFRKAMKKEIGQSLKQISEAARYHGGGGGGGLGLGDLDGQLCAVVRVLREASSITSSVFRSLSLFLSTQVSKAKPTSKWSLVSMMVHRGGVLGSQANEIESVDIALGELLQWQGGSSEGVEEDDDIDKKIQSAQTKLEALETVIQGFENELECLFRLFIHNRVCLLNVISQ